MASISDTSSAQLMPNANVPAALSAETVEENVADGNSSLAEPKPDEIFGEQAEEELPLLANLGANKFKYIGLPNYDMNKNIFEKSKATGGLAYTLANQSCDIDKEKDIEERLLNLGILPFEGDDEVCQDYIRGQHSGDKHVGLSCGRGKRKKKMTPESKGIIAAMMEVALALKARTDVFMASQRLNSKTVNNEEFSLAACQRIINSMNVLPVTYIKAMKYLMDNKEWCGIFGRMFEEYRWGWIAFLD